MNFNDEDDRKRKKRDQEDEARRARLREEEDARKRKIGREIYRQSEKHHEAAWAAADAKRLADEQAKAAAAEELKRDASTAFEKQRGGPAKEAVASGLARTLREDAKTELAGLSKNPEIVKSILDEKKAQAQVEKNENQAKKPEKPGPAAEKSHEAEKPHENEKPEAEAPRPVPAPVDAAKATTLADLETQLAEDRRIALDREAARPSIDPTELARAQAQDLRADARGRETPDGRRESHEFLADEQKQNRDELTNVIGIFDPLARQEKMFEAQLAHHGRVADFHNEQAQLTGSASEKLTHATAAAQARHDQETTAQARQRWEERGKPTDERLLDSGRAAAGIALADREILAGAETGHAQGQMPAEVREQATRGHEQAEQCRDRAHENEHGM